MLSDDLLKGISGIREYLGADKFSYRQVHYMVETGAIPFFRLPPSTVIFARKSELDQRFRSAQPEREVA